MRPQFVNIQPRPFENAPLAASIAVGNQYPQLSQDGGYRIAFETMAANFVGACSALAKTQSRVHEGGPCSLPESRTPTLPPR